MYVLLWLLHLNLQLPSLAVHANYGGVADISTTCAPSRFQTDKINTEVLVRTYYNLLQVRYCIISRENACQARHSFIGVQSIVMATMMMSEFLIRWDGGIQGYDIHWLPYPP